MIFNNEFGSKIRELRKTRMLSQKDVAEYLNVTPTQISDIENGKTAPSFQRAIMLATLFEISLDYLAGISNEPQVSQIDSLFASLTYEQQMKVLGYIDALKNDLQKGGKFEMEHLSAAASSVLAYAHSHECEGAAEIQDDIHLPDDVILSACRELKSKGQILDFECSDGSVEFIVLKQPR